MDAAEGDIVSWGIDGVGVGIEVVNHEDGFAENMVLPVVGNDDDDDDDDDDEGCVEVLGLKVGKIVTKVPSPKLLDSSWS